MPVVTSLRKRYGFNAGCEGYPRKSVSAHVITQADTDLPSYTSQRAKNPYLSDLRPCVNLYLPVCEQPISAPGCDNGH